jgi:PAS domain S-box-containing protein
VTTYLDTTNGGGRTQPRRARAQDQGARSRDEDRFAVEVALRQRLEAEAALARVSALLTSRGTQALTSVLRIMGELVAVSRAYVFMARDEGARFDNTHEWCAPGVRAQIDELQGLSAANFAWWMDRLEGGRAFCVPDVSALPHEAIRERQALEAQDIKSALIVPLTTREGRLLGFMGFDDVRAPRPWRDEDVRLLRVVAEMVAGDLQRRQGEEALRRREEYFRALIEDARTLILVLDADGTARYVSPAHQDVLGHTPEALTGTNVVELIHPDDRASARKILEELAGTPGRTTPLEVRVRHRDGSWRTLGGTVRNLLHMPAVEGLVVSGVDVTERRATEQRLRLLSQAVEASPVSIMITDPKGHIVYTNPRFSQTTGYTPDEVIGRRCFLDAECHDPAAYASLRESVAAGREWHGEIESRRKTGEAYQEMVSISPVRDADESITHFVGVKEDVTERRVLQAKFEQAQRMQMVGRLAGGVAHDINNLLTAIGGYADFLLEAIPHDDEMRGDVDEIVRAKNRAASIIAQLLTFSRRNVVDIEIVDVNQVARDIERMLERLIGEDVRLSVLVPPDKATIRGDRTQLEQVLVNLAVNARDAMPHGGALSITVEKTRVGPGAQGEIAPGDYVVLTVTDTGTGIPVEVREHLFEPFFTTKAAGEGSGLGLATVYGIVQAAGGHVAFESIVGAGTSFRVHLPAAEGQPPEPPPLPVHRDAGEEAILLVEDDAAVRRVARRILDTAGYAVIEAGNGHEALEAVERHAGEIDLVLTDAVMPELGGPELVRRLRSVSPGLRVLFMSGYALDDIGRRGDELGASAFLRKPFGSGELLGRVRDVLDADAPERPDATGGSGVGA